MNTRPRTRRSTARRARRRSSSATRSCRWRRGAWSSSRAGPSIPRGMRAPRMCGESSSSPRATWSTNSSRSDRGRRSPRVEARLAEHDPERTVTNAPCSSCRAAPSFQALLARSAPAYPRSSLLWELPCLSRNGGNSGNRIHCSAATRRQQQRRLRVASAAYLASCLTPVAENEVHGLVTDEIGLLERYRYSDSSLTERSSCRSKRL
jgi:hypothetical protein